MLYCDSLVWFLILDLGVLLRNTHLHSSLANFFKHIKYNVRGLKVSDICVNLQAPCLSPLVLNSFPDLFISSFIGEKHSIFPSYPSPRILLRTACFAQMEPRCPPACLKAVGFPWPHLLISFAEVSPLCGGQTLTPWNS